VTKDQSLAAHYEHTVALTSRGVEVLSLWDGGADGARTQGKEGTHA